VQQALVEADTAARQGLPRPATSEFNPAQIPTWAYPDPDDPRFDEVNFFGAEPEHMPPWAHHGTPPWTPSPQTPWQWTDEESPRPRDRSPTPTTPPESPGGGGGGAGGGDDGGGGGGGGDDGGGGE
jgi:uncharacterized membrane protein YgcG